MSLEVISMRDSDLPPGPGRMRLTSSRYIYFGPFRVDQQRQEVSRDGTRLKLQGKVYQILQVLLEKPGEVVTREELRMRLWPSDTHVNFDANVNTTVNKLRQALGDSTDKPLYVETIPRKGYSLLVQPEISDDPRRFLSGPDPAGIAVNPANLPQARAKDFSKSDFWLILGVIALILAGMLLGAGITRLWFTHEFVSMPFSMKIAFSILTAYSPL
jgi:DNA-binding winged helix-turn-helix (wHTH) protein